MQIETYEIQTASNNPVDAVIADAEHVELLTELGLERQKAMVTDANADETNLDAPSRPAFRFRAMSMREMNIYKVLCPNETDIKYYSADLIPIRVLRCYKEARDSGFCTQGFEVWHPANAYDDPVLVGKRQDKSTWRTDVYIIARWGAVLKPLAELQKEAKEIWTAKVQSKLTRFKREIDQELANVESYFDETVNDSVITEPSYSSCIK